MNAPADQAPPAKQPSPWSAGLKARCPRCGRGPLFRQMINIREDCSSCGLSYKFADSGDGPAIFVLFLLGAIMMGAALFVELTFEPPLWVHAVAWGPITMLLAIVLLRPMKATLIALQYRNKAELGRVEDAPARSVEDAPARSVEDAPARSVEDAPARSVEDAPARSVEDAPARSVEDAPARSVEDTPARSVGKSS